MNEQNLNPSQVSSPPTEPILSPQSRGTRDSAREILKNLYIKTSSFLYPKRKIFLVIFGVLFFILLVGIVLSAFKNKGTPTIQSSPTPEATPETKALQVSEAGLKLKTLKERVFGLDVYQRHLSPPSFDFKISF